MLIEQVSEATASPADNAHDVSLDEKPEPDTCTVAPTPAFGGLRVTEGIAAFTWKLAEAESPPGFAIAVIT